MPLLKPTQLEEAAELLRGGQVVAMPTETVYGLAALAMNLPAVAKVFKLKGRPRFDPLIVHAASMRQAFELAADVPPLAYRLAESFWPGPLTLVLEKVAAIDDLVTAGLTTVALRVPDHTLAQELIAAAGGVLAAPSANRFGGISPTRPQHVLQELGNSVPVLDGGPCRRGVESTVVAVCGEQHPVVLRLGAITVEQLSDVLGRPLEVRNSSDQPQTPGVPGAPGMLSRHYAPRTPLVLVERFEQPATGQRVGALSLDQSPVGYTVIERLATAGDLVEAAANLFAAMRRLDEADLTRIEAILVPEQGLGRAINDRLRRAAYDS
ncbi:MAG: threonylcarbamoyl-AMP synthase [Phycisphaeraceae bacterium]|nr:threonylcarbamoyl-AMP synthase [Phycisphaeraceae bacterium]